jgi:hypothetical protein
VKPTTIIPVPGQPGWFKVTTPAGCSWEQRGRPTRRQIEAAERRFSGLKDDQQGRTCGGGDGRSAARPQPQF